MNPSVHVHFLPDHVAPETLRGGVAVVLDILRASTTIVHALAAGAERVIPCESIEEARAAAANLPAGSFVLGGERGGVRIEGFDLGNSPLEYTPEAVGGKTVVFTTTNGTRALARCREADVILFGSLVNYEAVAWRCACNERQVHLVCAGTDGRIAAEDVLCAGAIVGTIEAQNRTRPPTEDSARIARDFWCTNSLDDRIFMVLRDSHGGRNLRDLGYDADIARSAKRSLYRRVPEFDFVTGDIRSISPKDDRSLDV